MYYFFSIVEELNYRKGKIIPGYILYRNTRLQGKRYTGFTISNKKKNLNKVLVTSITGNNTFILMMSKYRTFSEDRKNGSYRKVYPKGALFLFECNYRGERTGSALFIKEVPDMSIKGLDICKGVIDRLAAYLPTPNILFAELPSMDIYSSSYMLSAMDNDDLINFVKGENRLWLKR